MACQMFQFQSGAIKTFETSPSDCRYSRFQFQSGAIKTGRTGRDRGEQNRFNSNLVRLRQSSQERMITP